MRLPNPKHITHRRFNDALSIVVGAAALFILLSPLIPYVSLWWAQRTDKSGGFVYDTKLVPADSPKINKDDLKPIPKENRLVIPSMQLDEEIHEGKYASTLNKGVWRKPYTSSPDKGGNTVLAGHRFNYSKTSVFYHLDKIKQGDRFPLYWNGQEYNYEVSNILVVSPLALEVEKNTEEPMLTIYTCTPVWTSKQRLVIQAKLIEDLP